MWVWIILKSCISSAASSDWVCQTVVIKLQLNVLVYQPGGCQRAIITPAPIRWNYPEIGLWLISPAYIYKQMWYWPSMNIFMYWKQSSRFNLVRINWFTEQLEKVSLSPPWVAQTRFQSKVGCCQKQHQEVIWKQDFRTIVPVLEGRSYQFLADLSICVQSSACNITIKDQLAGKVRRVAWLLVGLSSEISDWSLGPGTLNL